MIRMPGVSDMLLSRKYPSLQQRDRLGVHAIENKRKRAGDGKTNCVPWKYSIMYRNISTSLFSLLYRCTDHFTDHWLNYIALHLQLA